MVNKGFKCPSCDSNITESKYYEILRISDEKKNIQKKLLEEKQNLKKEFEIKYEKQKSYLIKKAKEEASKSAKKDINKAKKEGVEKGIEKQKKRYEQVSKLYQGAQKRLEESENNVKKLREDLKKGTNPQLEGINFEHELVKELKQKFPNDRIEHHGQGGDILHYIVLEKKEIALIVYECKRTKSHSKSHVIQIKNDVIKHKANYGILVTFASSKDKSGFWIERDILIVHPWGAPHLVEILRKSLVQLHSLKLNDKELGVKAKKLIEYIKSNKFRNSIRDNINRTKDLNDILKREIEYLGNSWKQRSKHYNKIAEQSKEIEEESKTIVGEDSDLSENEKILNLEIKLKE